jgi:hypothetical protein
VFSIDSDEESIDSQTIGYDVAESRHSIEQNPSALTHAATTLVKVTYKNTINAASSIAENSLAQNGLIIVDKMLVFK